MSKRRSRVVNLKIMERLQGENVKKFSDFIQLDSTHKTSRYKLRFMVPVGVDSLESTCTFGICFILEEVIEYVLLLGARDASKFEY